MAPKRGTGERTGWHRRYWYEASWRQPSYLPARDLIHGPDAPITRRDARFLTIVTALVVVVPAAAIAAWWVIVH